MQMAVDTQIGPAVVAPLGLRSERPHLHISISAHLELTAGTCRHCRGDRDLSTDLKSKQCNMLRSAHNLTVSTAPYFFTSLTLPAVSPLGLAIVPTCHSQHLLPAVNLLYDPKPDSTTLPSPLCSRLRHAPWPCCTLFAGLPCIGSNCSNNRHLATRAPRCKHSFLPSSTAIGDLTSC